MAIVKRSNSPNWYIQFQLNGTTYIRSSRTTTKKVAEQMEIDWKAKLHGQQFLGHRERMTVRQAMEQFCDSKLGTPNHKSLLYSAKVLQRLLPVHRDISDLTSHDLERFKRDRAAEGSSPQTIKHNLNLVRCAWKYARKLGFRVSELEFPQIKLPKTPLRYLSEDEERRFLACLDPMREGTGLRPFEDRDAELKRCMQDAFDLVVLLLDTGARYGEIANIEWTRIDLVERSIKLWRPKVQNEAILYMTDRVNEILNRRASVRAGQFVFSNRKGGPRGYVSQAIRKALRKAGLQDCRIHTLRHTHASRLVQNGMSVYEVREILGHTDIKTTMRYAHLEARQVTTKARDVINRLNMQSQSTN
ncbi:tyrosine-type recombinase/integrase [Roseateles sp. PN1]|uniref:tyrosine-type recombinase/integrase n=1 Tax=Roseateles sp. PN1 TaxID=3137372 RepID=UPI0031387C55